MMNAFLDFTGQGLTFAVTGAGVSVDSATGQVAISSEACSRASRWWLPPRIPAATARAVSG